MMLSARRCHRDQRLASSLAAIVGAVYGEDWKPGSDVRRFLPCLVVAQHASLALHRGNDRPQPLPICSVSLSLQSSPINRHEHEGDPTLPSTRRLKGSQNLTVMPISGPWMTRSRFELLAPLAKLTLVDSTR